MLAILHFLWILRRTARSSRKCIRQIIFIENMLRARYTIPNPQTVCGLVGETDTHSKTVRLKSTTTPQHRLPTDLWLPDQRGLSVSGAGCR